MEFDALFVPMEKAATREHPAASGPLSKPAVTPNKTNAILLPANANAYASARGGSIYEWDVWWRSGSTLYMTGLGGVGKFALNLEAQIRELTPIKIVIAVKTSTLEKPLVGKEGFTPGRIVGEAHLYEMPSGSYLGGVPFTATNSREVQFSKYMDDDGNVSNDSWTSVNDDLKANARKAVHDAIAAQIPNADVP